MAFFFCLGFLQCQSLSSRQVGKTLSSGYILDKDSSRTPNHRRGTWASELDLFDIFSFLLFSLFFHFNFLFFSFFIYSCNFSLFRFHKFCLSKDGKAGKKAERKRTKKREKFYLLFWRKKIFLFHFLFLWKSFHPVRAD